MALLVRFRGMNSSEMVIGQQTGNTIQAAVATREQRQALLLDFRRSVFLYCLGFARNQAEAQDLTQETFAKAFEHLERQPADQPRAWLLRIARNTCIDQERRKRVRRLLMPWLAPDELDTATPAGRHEQTEQIEIVRRAIRALPQAQREVLVLREYNDLSYQEIAEVLGLNMGTVMSRINRARQAVHRHFQESHHEKPTR